MDGGKDEKTFDVRATTAGGREVAGQGLKAASVEELVRGLTAQGLQVSQVRGRSARKLFEPRAFSAEEFTVFNSELAAAARRGVALPGALRAISKDLGRRRVREAVEQVAAELEQGRDLAEALARRPEAFPPAYVALVRAGLASGNLAGTLLVFAEESRLTGRVRHNTRSALVYPLAILFGASVLMCLVGWTLMPMVEALVGGEVYDVLEPWDSGLSLITRILLLISPLMRVAPLILLALLGGALAAWKFIARQADGAVFLGWLALRAPLVGRFLRAVVMARFCRMLAGSLRSRLSVPEAVELAGLSTGNAAAQGVAARAAAAIREGQPLSGALGAAGRFFPTTLVWMLSLGEGRGEVSEALEEHAKLQEENAERLGRVIPAVAVTAVTVLSAGILFLSVVTVMGPLLQTLLMLNELAQ